MSRCCSHRLAPLRQQCISFLLNTANKNPFRRDFFSLKRHQHKATIRQIQITQTLNQLRHTTFSLRDYRRFLADNAPSIGAFKAQQQASFDAERERWKASGQDGSLSELDASPPPDESALPEGAIAGTHTVVIGNENFFHGDQPASFE